ncbi:hypothetical protein AMTR_s00049p00103990 [Amborella trichopoda]|uniref:Transposase MuDR plant domain-containing protein n=1 Tax=Amborella trichopoda TaxID=13333 RepID=W1PZP7_AMBTC|nr:hypothetical protein AMTR_s00049p00103990 [Amborella trichopoda]
MIIKYIDPRLSSNMIRINDDDDIANMMEGASPIAMYVSNRPIDSDYTEYQPPTMPDIGPSDCIEYRPPTIPDNDPSRLVIIQDEHESKIERHMDDIDLIESPLRINSYEVVLQDGQDFDNIQVCCNHLIDYAISQNFNLKFRKSDGRRICPKCDADGCSWQVRCWRINTTNLIRLKELINTLSCAGKIGRIHRPLARSDWVFCERPYLPALIVSNHQKGLQAAIETVFLTSEQGYCMKHLTDNFKKAYKNSALTELYWKVARILYISDFDEYMIKIKSAIAEAYD